MSESSRKFKVVIVCLLLYALLLLAGYWFFYKPSNNTQKRATIRPTRTTIEQKITITGQIAPRQKVKIKAQANGVLKDFRVNTGDWVNRGDLLARIKLLADPVEINQAQSQVNKARLEYERATQELRRRQKLYDLELIPLSQFQDDKLRFDLAQQALLQAEQELDLRTRGISKHQKHSATQITATVDGMVLERMVEEGSIITKANDMNEGTTIVTLADMHNLIFKGDVEEADAGRLRVGMPLTVSVGAFPEQSFNITLESIAPEARKTEQGRTVFEIKAPIVSQDGFPLRAGYSASAQITLAQHAQVLAIPESHLIFEQHQAFVLLQEKLGTFRTRAVKTGLSDGYFIEITDGLSDHDIVAIP